MAVATAATVLISASLRRGMNRMASIPITGTKMSSVRKGNPAVCAATSLNAV